MNSLTEFRPHQSASTVNSALKKATRVMSAAKDNAILWFSEVNSRQLYKELDYSSIHQYAEQELGFGRSKTFYFLKVCRKLENLPKIKEKVETGELGIANTMAIIDVSDAKNEDQWLDRALKTPNRKLKDDVKKAKRKAAAEKAGQSDLGFVEKTDQKPLPPAVIPVLERLEFSPTQFARYEKLWEKIRQKGQAPADKIEALLEMMACYVEAEPVVVEKSKRLDCEQVDGQKSKRLDSGRQEASRPSVQIHIHQCPDCQQATVQTSKGEVAISQAEMEQARCDCLINRPGQRNLSAIAPATRRQVLARDRHHCQRPGCGHSRHLEIHHIVPRSQGGGNDAENLTTLCSTCHKLLHENKLAKNALLVKSPEGVYQTANLRAGSETYPPAGHSMATDWAPFGYECVTGGASCKGALPQGSFIIQPG